VWSRELNSKVLLLVQRQETSTSRRDSCHDCFKDGASYLRRRLQIRGSRPIDQLRLINFDSSQVGFVPDGGRNAADE